MWQEHNKGFLKWVGNGVPIPPPPQYNQLRNAPLIAKPKMKKCRKRKVEKEVNPRCRCTSFILTCLKLDKQVVEKDCAFCTINEP